MTTTAYRTCHLCEAMCGLALEIDDGRVVGVTGDADDPFSQGYLCPKGASIADVHDDPDRLRRPLRREGDAWVEIGWDEALDLAAAGIQRVQHAHGKHAVALYAGNPTAHTHGALFLPLLIKAVGSRNFATASTVDQRPHEFVHYHLYGHSLLTPIPDVDRSDLLLIFGANPAVSNGSLWTAPDLRRRLKDLRKRGGQVILFDPRRTETARLADAHHFVRPGTDALVLAAMVNTVFDEGLDDPGVLAEIVDGLDLVRAAVAEFTPESVAERTGVDATTIREVARAFAAADSAAAYGRVGVCHQRFGTVAAWLIHVLNIVTGNLDRPGGVLFTTPAFDLVSMSRGGYDRWRSRVDDTPEFNGEIPVAALADEILTPGDGQVRAVITHAGNPVLSTPDGRRLDEAFEDLDFFVAIDIYVNETTRHADVILPTTSALERSHFDHAFNVLACRNTVRWDPPVFDKPDDTLHDWEVVVELARRLYGDDDRAATIARRYGPASSPDDLVDLGLQHGPHGDKGLSIEMLRDEHPHGLDLGPLEPQLPGRLRTADQRIALAPEVLLDELAALEDGLAPPSSNGFDLVLIGRRQLRSNNSWMHNVDRLVKGRDRCTVLVHPDDAKERGIDDGAAVVVTSAVGSIEVPAEVSDEIMPGVVSVPHGWGHDRDGVGWQTATENAGASVNDVTDAGLRDRLTGNVAFSEVPVRIAPAS